MESYDHIELTDEEKAEWLRKGREDKHYAIQREKYLGALRQPRLSHVFTAEEYYKAFTQHFPINEKQEKEYAAIVKRLCCYFANDKRFETTDLKLNRGILLFGGVGVGKTTLMQMFRQNQAFSYRVISCRQIESEYGTDGADVILKYSANYQVATNSNPFGHQEIGYCFDDLGTENSVTKHFGNAKNVMADIILNRYDNRAEINPRGTHITTNLAVDEIERLYGTRVIDRIRELFNIIEFHPATKSRR